MFIKKCSSVAVMGAALFLFTVGACLSGAQAAENTAIPAETTLDNLMTAYNNESNAALRYLAFAKQANVEGYDIAASLFRAIALAEQVHCERYAAIIKRLGGTPQAIIETPEVKGTKENLEATLKGETYEKDVMYPGFLKQAQKENIKDAAEAFKDAIATEGSHIKLYTGMSNNMTLSQGLSKDFYVCPVCGYVTDAITSAMCPICSTDTRKFRRVK